MTGSWGNTGSGSYGSYGYGAGGYYPTSNSASNSAYAPNPPSNPPNPNPSDDGQLFTDESMRRSGPIIHKTRKQDQKQQHGKGWTQAAATQKRVNVIPVLVGRMDY